MADANVLAAQKYLNSIFGHREEWVKLKENGNTGSLMMEGLIRAFQIQNGVPDATGFLGPVTIAKMKSLPKIKKMAADDDALINVCLIQCALFCKGYHAGGITGIYYTNGVNAVKQMQSDAGFENDGIIDWKVWAGLFSLNWFQTVSGGNSKVRSMQQQMNRDYVDYIGVQACDGIISRNTALSVLCGLQVSLGVITEYINDLSTLNFGDLTRAAFLTKVGSLMYGDNNSSKKKYVRLAQYGLYFNGCDPYTYDGSYDSTTQLAVKSFQTNYGLTGIGLDEGHGVIGLSTMMSLLTSKGDTERNAQACDCSTILNSTQAKALKSKGYTYVGRYLTGTVGVGIDERDKSLSKNEIKIITSAGLSIFPIYQDGGYYLNYFKNNSMRGYEDAVYAAQKAQKLGFPKGVTIYFAVDFDCMEYEAEEYIVPYFKAIKQTFDTYSYGYKIGIYAPRRVCTIVQDKGYTSHSFVADMSTGFSGNLGYPIPDNWAFDQFCEYKFSSTPAFDLDKVAYSGRDSGCSVFNTVPDETEADKLQLARDKYTRNFLSSISSLKQEYVTTEFAYDGTEYYLGQMSIPNATMSMSFYCTGKATIPGANENSIKFTYKNDGSLSEQSLDKIKAISNDLKSANPDTNVNELLQTMALKLKSGSVIIKIKPHTATSMTVEITGTTDLKEKYGVVGSVSVTVKMTIMFGNQFAYEGIKISELDLTKVTQATLSALAAIGMTFLESAVTWWKNGGRDATYAIVLIVIVMFALAPIGI